jgi:hypothetical protein
MSDSILNLADQLQKAAEGVVVNKDRATRKNREILEGHTKTLKEFQDLTKHMRIAGGMLHVRWSDKEIDQTSARRVAEIGKLERSDCKLTISVNLKGEFKLNFEPRLTDHSLGALKSHQGGFALSSYHSNKRDVELSRDDKVITCVVAWLTDRDNTFPNALRNRIKEKVEREAKRGKTSKPKR